MRSRVTSTAWSPDDRHGPRRHRASHHRPQARRGEADEQPGTGRGLAGARVQQRADGHPAVRGSDRAQRAGRPPVRDRSATSRAPSAAASAPRRRSSASPIRKSRSSPHRRAAWLPTLLGQLVGRAAFVDHGSSSSIDPSVGYIRGDREHLEQVITNLVFNARDAIAGEGTIQVGVALRDGAELARISVCDDGPASRRNDRPHLRAALHHQAQRHRARSGHRPPAHGKPGRIAHRREPPGRRLRISRARAAAAEPGASVEPLAPRRPDVKRILLVEDDLSVGAGLEALLNSKDTRRPGWARRARCAAARENAPQVAIIDVNLPDGNGVDLVPSARRARGLPIVSRRATWS